MALDSMTNQETRTFTRLQHPGRQRVARLVWLALAAALLLVYIIGFVDFPGVLQRGLLLIDTVVLQTDSDEQITVSAITAPSDLRAGDVLLAIDGDDSVVTPLLAWLNGGDSSGLSTFPLAVGGVGDAVTLTVRGADGVTRSVVQTIEQPNNLLMRALTTLGFSVSAAAAFTFSIELLYALVFIGIAGVIYLNRSDDWMALLVAAALLAVGLGTGLASHPNSIVWQNPVFKTVVLSSGLVMISAGLLFPEGRLMRWSLVVFVIYAVQLLLTFVSSVLRLPLPAFMSGVIQALYVASLIGIIVTVRYRYQNVLTAPQQQQMKWLILGFFALVIGLIIVTSYRVLFQLGLPQLALPYFAIAFPLETLLSLALPIGVVFAIMQYRLWEIDLVLNRSVVYGSVIVGLILIFAVVFIAAQILLTAVMGPASDGVALAISALVVGLAFNPARSRIQHYVDRRLFGLRFDLNQLKAAQRSIDHPGNLTGRTLGGYTLADLIGRGGMGEVYKGYDDQQIVAIKTLRDDIDADVKAHERFEREARFQLDHPNIARIVSIGEEDGIHYLVMDFIEGRDLRTHLRERGPEDRFDLETVVGIISDVCAGLQAAHDAGYVHRDIKPGNIILRPNDDNETYTAVITDFGVAKMDNATAITGTGAIGTIDYMAPEQIQAARSVDARADIYALGVVMYEMLTGTRPFSGTAAQVMFAHLQQPPPDPLHLNPYLPISVVLASMQAMAKDPQDRFRDAAEFARLLRD